MRYWSVVAFNIAFWNTKYLILKYVGLRGRIWLIVFSQIVIESMSLLFITLITILHWFDRVVTKAPTNFKLSYSLSILVVAGTLPTIHDNSKKYLSLFVRNITLLISFMPHWLMGHTGDLVRLYRPTGLNRTEV